MSGDYSSLGIRRNPCWNKLYWNYWWRLKKPDNLLSYKAERAKLPLERLIVTGPEKYSRKLNPKNKSIPKDIIWPKRN